MTNTILFFITVIVTFGSLTIISRLCGKEGLFGWIGMSVVVANILVTKCVDLFGMSATLGNVLFGSVFLATDILHENYGKRTAQKAIKVGVIIEIVALTLFQVALAFIPNELDVVQSSMETLLTTLPRISLASVSMFLVANFVDILLFEKIKKLTKGKHLWLRNNVSTMIAQSIENLLFYIIAFIGIYSFKDILEMTIICCLIEMFVALLDTPFLYLATKIKKRKDY